MHAHRQKRMGRSAQRRIAGESIERILEEIEEAADAAIASAVVARRSSEGPGIPWVQAVRAIPSGGIRS
ncbi:hypothetical protein ACH4T9_06605 [Micromonospora sp. NPDC020750]|uniref:hypothetical protein n=1 Tax=unclassified Micromonospora TaxID=2617518 RepID=UPI0037B4522E